MSTWHIAMLAAFITAPAVPPKTYKCGKSIERLVWSDDSRKLAFGEAAQACILDVASKQVTRLTAGTFYAWQPGTRQFVMEPWYRDGEHTRTRLSVVDADNMQELASRKLRDPVSVVAPLSTRYSSDGTLIARMATATQAVVFRADTLASVPLPAKAMDCYDLAGYWQPGSHRLLMLSDCLGKPFPTAQRMTVIDVDTATTVREVAEWHNVNMTDREYAWSPDGSSFVLPLMSKQDLTVIGIAAYNGEGGLLYKTDITKARSKSRRHTGSDDWRYTFNPSGSLLAVDTGDADSAIIDARTGDVVLPYGPVGNYEQGFDWLNDDLLLTTETETAALSIVDARNGSKTSVKLPRAVAAFETTVSPDKQHVAFCDASAAYVMRLTDGEILATTRMDVRTIAWAPDGRRVAFNSDTQLAIFAITKSGAE